MQTWEETDDIIKAHVREIPPYNGFGSEEDSLQSAIYLVPRVPKKNFVKMNKLDGKILRFAAKMLNGRQV